MLSLSEGETRLISTHPNRIFRFTSSVNTDEHSWCIQTIFLVDGYPAVAFQVRSQSQGERCRWEVQMVMPGA